MFLLPTGVVRSFTHVTESKLPLNLPTKKDPSSSTTLAELIKENVPALNEGSMGWLDPRLFNGHLQTVYSARKDPLNLIWYARRLVRFKDDATISADYCVPAPESPEVFAEQLKYIPEGANKRCPIRTRYLKDDEIAQLHPVEADGGASAKPLVIALHGMTGGSHEAYVRAVVAELVSPAYGFECVVLNSRGCNQTKLTSKQLFCALMTDDIRRFIKLVRRTQPKRRIYAMGFSLGAAILANYIAQEGQDDKDSQLDAACIVSCPWDLAHDSYYLSSSVMGENLYHPQMTKNLLRLLERHDDILKDDPVFANWRERSKGIRHIYEFDNLFTGPAFGFNTAFEYYRAGSPNLRVIHTKTPALILHSLDDPVADAGCIPYPEIAKNPFLFCATTDGGGHLGWFTPNGQRWNSKPIADFFKAYNDNISPDRSLINHDFKLVPSVYKDGKLVLRTPDLEED